MSMWVKKETSVKVMGVKVEHWWQNVDNLKPKPFVIQKNVVERIPVTRRKMRIKTERERFAIDTLKHYMHYYGLTQKGWGYEFDVSKSRAGQCRYRTKTIGLSRYYVNHKSITDNQVKNTILHEIAHALTKGHNHDEVWRQKALEIGCDGKKCWQSTTEYYKYKYSCGKGCEMGRHVKSKMHERALKGALTCRKHNMKIFLVY